MGGSQGNIQKNVRAYRWSMYCAIFMAVMAGLAVICCTWINPRTDTGQWVSVFVSLCTWPLIAYICKLKISILQLKQTLHDIQTSSK